MTPCLRCAGSGHEPVRRCLARVEVALRTVSESNHAGAVRDKARRRKHQRRTVALYLQATVGRPPEGKLVVRTTRLAPRELDAHDNLRGALKYVVDGIGDWLGLRSDRDPRIVWDYAQEKPEKPGHYAIRIELFAYAEAPAPEVSR